MTTRQAARIVGRSRKLRWAGLSTRIPAHWTHGPEMTTDPPNMLRLEYKDRRLPTGKDYKGDMEYFTYPVIINLYLGMRFPTKQARQAFLQRWMTSQLKPKVMSSSISRLPIAWSRVTYQESALPKGGTVGLLIAVGQTQQAGLAPVAVMTVGAVVVRKGDVAVYGSGLVGDYKFQQLTPQQRNIATQTFTAHGRQVGAVAALTKLGMGRRDRGMERKLARRGHFLHASRYSSTMGGISRTSFSSCKVFQLRFVRGHRCILKTSFSNLANYQYRSLQAPMGAAPSFQTTSAGRCPNKTMPAAPYQVRRGQDGAKWLVIYYPANLGGPAFFKISRKTRRCGRKRITGMAIGGHVEGIFSQFGISCIYKSSRHGTMR